MLTARKIQEKFLSLKANFFQAALSGKVILRGLVSCFMKQRGILSFSSRLGGTRNSVWACLEGKQWVAAVLLTALCP